MFALFKKQISAKELGFGLGAEMFKGVFEESQSPQFRTAVTHGYPNKRTIRKEWATLHALLLAAACQLRLPDEPDFRGNLVAAYILTLAQNFPDTPEVLTKREGNIANRITDQLGRGQIDPDSALEQLGMLFCGDVGVLNIKDQMALKLLLYAGWRGFLAVIDGVSKKCKIIS